MPRKKTTVLPNGSVIHNYLTADDARVFWQQNPDAAAAPLPARAIRGGAKSVTVVVTGTAKDRAPADQPPSQ